jgi:hypothetical protein
MGALCRLGAVAVSVLVGPHFLHKFNLAGVQNVEKRQLNGDENMKMTLQ